MKDAILVPGIIAGVLLGLAFMALSTLSDDLGYTTQEVLGLVAIALAVIGAQVAAIRRHPLGADIPYLVRYFAGMLAGVVVAVVYAILVWIYVALINPRYLEEFYTRYVERATEGVQTAAERNELIVAAERMRDFILDPLSQSLVQFGTVLVIALLTGLLVAVFVNPVERP